jgi:UDP-glucose 4-epimerase
MLVADRSLTVLVTGGSGFIGSHVVDRLLAAGHRPRIYDARPSPFHAPDDVPATVGDLADLPALREAMTGCDAVIHLAAAADVNEVEAAPLDAEARNSRGTAHVLEASRECEVGRVVYASTIWVYSDTPAPCHDETLALHAPAHLYTATKLAGEHYCHSYGELYGIEHTILRFGIPYGPRCRPAAVVPAFVNRALAGEPLKIAGDGSQSRRFVYVEDLAEGVVRALAPLAANQTYNLVGTEDVTIRQVAEAVREAIGDVTLEHMPGRTGDFAGAPVSADRAAADLNWTATTPFAEGVRRYVEWHRATAAEAEAASVAVATRARRRVALVGAFARRGALAVACAALAAAMLVGVLTLLPLDSDFDAYDTFTAVLVLMLPLVLAGGFQWDGLRARGLSLALAVAAVAALAVAVLPWPHFLDHLGHGHGLALLLFAAIGLSASRLPGRQAPLRALLSVAGD